MQRNFFNQNLIVYALLQTDAQKILEKKSLVIMNNEITIEILATPLNENNEPALSRAICVSGYSDSTSENDLKIFFKDRKISGGDSVESVLKIDTNKRKVAVVVFNKDGGTNSLRHI